MVRIMEQIIADSWTSYPRICALGHAEIKDLLLDPCLVQEKLDGSQFSFGKFGNELRMKSKSVPIHEDSIPDIFKTACEWVMALSKERLLHEGWTYRAEAICRPQHNTLKYSRAPNHGLILFDISIGLEEFAKYGEVVHEAERLGLEVVPTYGMWLPSDKDLTAQVNAWLEKESFLGGCKIEGVVFKNYTRFGRYKKPLMGKYVSEKFKEQHKKVWKQGIPMADLIGGEYRNDARWNKAIQHLREQGTLTDSPKDIGPILKEIQIDLLSEGKEDIKERLFNHFWKDIARRVVAGFPEFYKRKLLETQPIGGPEMATPLLAPAPAALPLLEGCTDEDMTQEGSPWEM